ncbi:hypothetical protein KIPB_005794, partial [Kipferlia bialata]
AVVRVFHSLADYASGHAPLEAVDGAVQIIVGVCLPLVHVFRAARPDSGPTPIPSIVETAAEAMCHYEEAALPSPTDETVWGGGAPSPSASVFMFPSQTPYDRHVAFLSEILDVLSYISFAAGDSMSETLDALGEMIQAEGAVPPLVESPADIVPVLQRVYTPGALIFSQDQAERVQPVAPPISPYPDMLDGLDGVDVESGEGERESREEVQTVRDGEELHLVVPCTPPVVSGTHAHAHAHALHEGSPLGSLTELVADSFLDEECHDPMTVQSPLADYKAMTHNMPSRQQPSAPSGMGSRRLMREPSFGSPIAAVLRAHQAAPHPQMTSSPQGRQRAEREGEREGTVSGGSTDQKREKPSPPVVRGKTPLFQMRDRRMQNGNKPVTRGGMSRGTVGAMPMDGTATQLLSLGDKLDMLQRHLADVKTQLSQTTDAVRYRGVHSKRGMRQIPNQDSTP